MPKDYNKREIHEGIWYIPKNHKDKSASSLKVQRFELSGPNPRIIDDLGNVTEIKSSEYGPFTEGCIPIPRGLAIQRAKVLRQSAQELENYAQSKPKCTERDPTKDSWADFIDEPELSGMPITRI